MKYCPKCGKRKSHKQFSKDSSKWDFRRTICMTCDREASRVWYRDVGKEQRYPSPNLDLTHTAAA